MSPRSFVSQQWKTNVKTILAIVSFPLFLLTLSSTPVEARDYHIQASDGEVYTVTLGENPGILNFTVKDTSGEILSGATEDERAVAAELYYAAKFFWHILPRYSPDTPFEDWEASVEDISKTAIIKLLTKQGLDILTNGLVNGFSGAVQKILFGTDTASIVAGWLPGALSDAIGDELEHRVLIDAAVIARGAAQRTVEHENVLRAFWLAYETRSAVVSMDEVNAAWESFYKSSAYLSLTSGLVDGYLKDPESEISIGTGGLDEVAAGLVPSAQPVIKVLQVVDMILLVLETIDTINYTLEHIQQLRNINETAVSRIHQQAFALIAAGKEGSRAELEAQSFFQPRLVVPLEDIRISVDDGPQSVDVRDYFLPNGNNLTYVPVSSDSSVVVSRTERTGSSVIIMTPNGVGTASITVHLMNFRGLSVTESFTVTVTEDTLQSQVPEPDDPIEHQLLLIDGPPLTLDVAEYFSWDKPLDYEVSSDPSGIVEARVAGSLVTITPRQIGNASVVVTAYDRDDRSLSTIQTIPVLVYTDRATIVRPPSSTTFRPPTTSNPSAEGLARGVSVIVQNTLGLGLNIRSNPWVSNNNPDNRIGRVHDGATGTITDGPQQNGGFRWWKIDWDLENKEGWSADFVQGAQIIFRRPPDLEIRDFDVSDDKVKPGEDFRLEVEIRNNGPGDSEPTEIYFYYRLSGEEDDVRVAGKGKVDVPSIDEGKRRDVLLRVSAPMTPHTDYDYGAILPPDIPETYDADLVDPTKQMRLNNVAEERVRVTSSPDLVVESITASKSVLDPGEEFTLEATVRNRGLGEPEYNAILDYYRSSDAYITTRDREVGDDVIRSEDLNTNEITSESIHLNAPSEPGVYYYGACVDVRNESDTDNNCSGGVAITVRETNASDLVVSLVTLSDNTLAPGTAFTLDATVENRGDGTARPTTLRVYRSVNASISSNDVEVGSVNIGSLSGGATEVQQVSLTAPLASGMYYYGVSVESVVNERNTANNNSAGVALTIENLAPVASGRIPAQTLVAGNEIVLDVSAYFSDPNADVLTYYVFSNAASVVVAEFSGLSNSELTLTPLGAGTATITVEVSDGEFTATQTIDVSVTTPSVSEASWMPDANLRAAVRRVLGLAPGDVLTKEAMQRLTKLDASWGLWALASEKIIDLTGLEHAKQLTWLALSSNGIVDVSALSGLSQLTFLSLNWNEVLDLGPLSGLSQLTTLYLRGNAIVDVSALSGLSQLMELGLDQNKILAVSPLSGLSQLTTLYLWGNGIVDVSALSGLTELTELYLNDNAIVDVSPLSGLSQLTTLYLGENNVVDVSALSGLSQLTFLDLRHNNIVDVSALSGLSQLTTLYLWENEIIDVSALSGLSQLTTLYLGENNIVDVSPLSGLGQLTELGFRHNNIVDVSALSGLIQLTFLDLRHNNIVDVSALSGLSQLTTLDLGENAIVDVSALSGLSQLTTLHLSGNTIANLAPLRELSAKNPNLLIDIDINAVTTPVSEETWMPDANLRAKVREELGLAPGDILTKETMQGLTELDASLTWYAEASERISDLTGLQHATQLTELNFSRNEIVDVSPLSSLTQLTTLSLDVNEIVDVSPLSGLTQLTTLSLWANEIVDVSPLSSLTQLTELNFSWNEIVDVSPLSGLSQLMMLDLSANVIVDVSPLSSLTQLTMSDLGGNEIVDVSPLSVLSQLTSLSLDGNSIVDVSPLSGLNQLRVLSLVSNEIVDIGPLSGLSQLTELYLRFNYIVDVSALSGLSQLWVLDLNQNDIIDLSPLSGLTQLKTLNLGADLGGKNLVDISPLSSLSQLRELYLNGNAIVDVSSLSGLNQLTRLVLHYNKVVDISPLSGLSQLPELHLSYNKIVDISPLSDLSQLRELGLSGNAIVDIGPLSSLSQLTVLSLTGNKIVDINPLAGLTQLTELYLGSTWYSWASELGNKIVDISALSGMTQLRELSLGHNGVVDVSPLSSLSQLRQLYLWENEVIDVSPLSGLSQLTLLHLRDNKISDVSALEGLINVKRLNLRGNPIADLAPLRRLKAKNPDVEIDIDIDADAPAAPAAPTLSVETALLPNYPNPFNPETWIPYQLSKPADVTMSIYSVDGKLVRRLGLGHQAAGVYQSRVRAVYWDGRNNVGERVASGIYFYTFSAGNFTATRKMLIRK